MQLQIKVLKPLARTGCKAYEVGPGVSAAVLKILKVLDVLKVLEIWKVLEILTVSAIHGNIESIGNIENIEAPRTPQRLEGTGRSRR